MDYRNHQTEYVLQLIRDDGWMMDVLKTVQALRLPDWWIASGFVRNKVWDTLHGYHHRTVRTDMDIDVIYFDREDLSPETEKDIELSLFTAKPGVPWQVKNQARMHERYGEEPYASSLDAISRWPEIATCIGVCLDDRGNIRLAAPYGVADIMDLIVRPNPQCRRNPMAFEQRVNAKHWKEKWPRLTITHEQIDNRAPRGK